MLGPADGLPSKETTTPTAISLPRGLPPHARRSPPAVSGANCHGAGGCCNSTGCRSGPGVAHSRVLPRLRDKWVHDHHRPHQRYRPDLRHRGHAGIGRADRVRRRCPCQQRWKARSARFRGGSWCRPTKLPRRAASWAKPGLGAELVPAGELDGVPDATRRSPVHGAALAEPARDGAPRGHRCRAAGRRCADATGWWLRSTLGQEWGRWGCAYAQRHAAARVYLAEIDPAAAELARANIAANGLGERVHGRGRRRARGRRERRSTSCSPIRPFTRPGRRASPTEREIAHVMPAGGLDAWIRAALARLRARGRHRDRSTGPMRCRRSWLSLDRRFGGVQVIPVLPRADAPATRVLVTGVKGSRAPFALRPPLVLHDEDGAFTPFAAALHRGESVIGWGPGRQ